MTTLSRLLQMGEGDLEVAGDEHVVVVVVVDDVDVFKVDAEVASGVVSSQPKSMFEYSLKNIYY
jgi:hypothetical protein